MRKFSFLFLLLSACLIAACRQVLPKDRMVDLLTDMYLYDEELAKNMQGVDSVSVYRSVFLQHGCAEADYKEAIAYYVKNPKEMKEIYEAVKARLEGYKADYEQALQLEDSLRNLWVAPYDTLFQSADRPPQAYAFSIPVDTLCVYTLSVSVQYFDDDSTQRPHMKGYLWGKFGKKDTTVRKDDAMRGQRKQRNRALAVQELPAMEFTQEVKTQKNLKKQKPLKSAPVNGKRIKHQVPDTVRQEKEVEFVRGETKTYTLSFSVDDTLVTHIKGFWLLTDKRDTIAPQHIYLSRFRVHKPRKMQPPFVLESLRPVQSFEAIP
jgi:hypothetical protein